MQPVEQRQRHNGRVRPRKNWERAGVVDTLGASPAIASAKPTERVLGRALGDLKACLWTGSRQPLNVRLTGPVPIELMEFATDGDGWLDLVYPSDRRLVEEWAGARRNHEAAQPIEYRLVTESADIVWVRQWLRHEGGRLRGRGARVWGLLQVINEQKRLESECLRVCERERSAIGQELHDDVCQLLAGMACVLEVVTRRVVARVPDMRPLLSELAVQLQNGMERTRSLAHGLVPARLVNLGLARALRELADQARILYGVKIQLRLTKRLPAHSSAQILQLYRIAQESISNAVKHGKATTIQLTLRQRGDEFMLSIQDNGTGLPPEAARPNGIGLYVMGYRASEIGATFRLDRPASGGVRVVVTYACKEPSSQILET